MIVDNFNQLQKHQIIIFIQVMSKFRNHQRNILSHGLFDLLRMNKRLAKNDLYYYRSVIPLQSTQQTIYMFIHTSMAKDFRIDVSFTELLYSSNKLDFYILIPLRVNNMHTQSARNVW